MKHMIKLLNNSTKPYYFSLSVLTFFSLLIWYAGPLLTMAHYAPLATPEKRFYAILLILMGWILKINFLHAKPAPKDAPTSQPPAEFTQKLDFLTGRFQGALDFLQKTFISKHGKEVSLSTLSWYLMLGPSGAGKTTLLANSNINFILSKQFKHDDVSAMSSTEVCDWWVTRDSVLVDVPGFYLQSKVKSAAQTAQSVPQPSLHYILWHNFLRLIKKFRGKQALGGIVLTLPLVDVMSQANPGKERMLSDLKLRITELREEFGAELPVQLIITQCDLLPGFIEFFSDSGSDELSQAWGVTIPVLKENEQIIDVLSSRFNALIKRLNKQLIWRLHQERNAFIRPLVKDFPLQIERLKENILNLLKTLSIPEKNIRLQGVYLTSAIQHPRAETATPLEEETSSTALQITQNPIMPARAYFVRQLLLQGILNNNSHGETDTIQSRLTRPKIYAITLGVIIIAIFLFGKDLKHGISQTYAIRDGLEQYHQMNKQGPELIKALPLLNALQQTAYSSSHALFFYSDKAQQSAMNAYQQALLTIVLPEVKNDLEKLLDNHHNKSPDVLYAALQAYLMLANSRHLQSEFIINTLKITEPALFAANSDQVTAHIRAAFNTVWRPIELNSDLIAQTRKRLFALTPSQLSFVILKNMTGNSALITLNLGTSTDNSPLALSLTPALPAMYTGEFFQSIYDQQIDTATQEATQGNWTLGTISTLNGHSNSNAALTAQLRVLYLTNYISAWENLVSSMQMQTPADLNAVNTAIIALASKNSPLLQFLATIKQNTAFKPVTSASPKLSELNNVLTNNQQERILTALAQTQQYLQTILTAPDKDKAAFDAASLRMKKAGNDNIDDALSFLSFIATRNPEPIKSWLTNLATLSWHYILADTGHFVENHWQTDVMQAYRAQFANRYPFTPLAQQEVSLEQFSQFLGAQGTLAHFQQTYLSPFLENTDAEWRLKKMDNQQIPFSPQALAQLRQATKIQHLFFPNNDNQVLIKFLLKPISLEGDTKSLALNINGQAIQYNRSLPIASQTLKWPGNKSTHETLLSLVSNNNQPAITDLKGDWAWFKLINNAKPKIVNQKVLVLHFNVNGFKAKYLLLTHDNVNPFLTTNLQQFKLPEQLIVH